MSEPSKAMRLRVTYLDGRVVETVARPKDIVAFERQYQVSFADFSNLEHVYYMAWSPLHRSGAESHPFDEFLDLIDNVEEIEDEKEPVPFETAPSDEPSPT